jgi:hypothetical protein
MYGVVYDRVVGDSTVWCSGVLANTWTGRRVWRVNFVLFLDVIPRALVLFLFVFVFFVVVLFVVLFFVVNVLGFFASAVLFFTGAGGDDLDPSWVLVGKIVVVVVVEGTRMVVDSDSLP